MNPTHTQTHIYSAAHTRIYNNHKVSVFNKAHHIHFLLVLASKPILCGSDGVARN